MTEVVNEDEWPSGSEDLEGYWSEDSSFSDIVVGETEIEGDLVGEELFSDYIDESLINVINNTLNQSCSQTKVSGNAHFLNVDDVNVEIGSEEELVSDDDNRSVVGSDDELGSHDVFDPTVDFEKPILLKVGLLFPSVEVLRKAVRQHAIENGYEPYFLHNESARVSIQCRHRCDCTWNSKKSRLPKCTCGVKNPCLYRLTATKVKGEDSTFEIKSLYLEHICVYTTKNRMVTSEFIAQKYLETWRSDPGKKRWGIKVRAEAHALHSKVLQEDNK
ncbi:uncharacterized protein LOC141637411 [Silene latifolia]|uniref:uncharacterized protein LOC141637411 n=1 Tax=Silene latifolia TaxID=37657 RepID=UPI003D774FE0